MLHIVQAVLAGKAEVPRILTDRAEAESAYVKNVRKWWKQPYSAYCESHGVADSFASAKAFVDSLDGAEKSTINYWVVKPEDVGLEAMKRLEGMRQGLTGLLEDMAHLMDLFGGAAAGDQGAGPEADAGLSASTAEEAKPEEVEVYTTKEWKAYVGTIVNMCGGSRSEFPSLPRSDWRQEVYSDSTSLEYWDWVGAKIKTYREEAEKAGYEVVEDTDSPGHFRFRSPEGTGETSYYSEWEAWCHAGMELPGESAVAAD